MSNEQFDLEADVQAAWGKFRSRLADRVAAMADDDLMLVKVVTGVDGDELKGAAPYLQYCAHGDGLVRVEVVSNTYLDDRFQLSDGDEAELLRLGWEAPRMNADGTPMLGWQNFNHGAERRDADRIAVMCVAALRDVFSGTPGVSRRRRPGERPRLDPDGASGPRASWHGVGG